VRLIPFATLLALTACTTQTSMPKPIQTAQVLNTTVSKKAKANYLLFLPEGYDARSPKRWPLILFLHGIGERGSDPWKVKVHGPPKVAEQLTNFPFIVLSPQCPNGQWWSNEILIALLDETIARHNVDTNRIYLTGLSMGGFGAWSLALEFPERFAAVAPLCGGGNPYYPLAHTGRRKAALKSLPFWAFHGDKDPAVALEESERMVKAVQKLGCDVKLTIYPGVGHDCWTQTYNDPQLYEWFLQHERK
jgi:predicted peptidase